MRIFPTLVFTVILVSLGSVALRAQDLPPVSVPPVATPAPTPHKPVVPLLPSELLALLPKTPDKWQLKQSQASNFMMVWASSQAMREFNYTPPPSATANPGDAPPPPLVLRIAIIDTGHYHGLIGDFEKIPPTKPGGVQSLTLDGFPARESPMGTIGERLRVLINGRYVVQIDVQNQPANSSQQWLQIVDVAKIAALSVDGEEKLPRPFPITRIDEVNPQNSSVSTVTWGTQEELDATRRRH